MIIFPTGVVSSRRGFAWLVIKQAAKRIKKTNLIKKKSSRNGYKIEYIEEDTTVKKNKRQSPGAEKDTSAAPVFGH